MAEFKRVGSTPTSDIINSLQPFAEDRADDRAMYGNQQVRYPSQIEPIFGSLLRIPLSMD
jgi:hypothetical protein